MHTDDQVGGDFLRLNRAGSSPFEADQPLHHFQSGIWIDIDNLSGACLEGEARLTRPDAGLSFLPAPHALQSL